VTTKSPNLTLEEVFASVFRYSLLLWLFLVYDGVYLGQNYEAEIGTASGKILRMTSDRKGELILGLQSTRIVKH